MNSIPVAPVSAQVSHGKAVECGKKRFPATAHFPTGFEVPLLYVHLGDANEVATSLPTSILVAISEAVRKATDLTTATAGADTMATELNTATSVAVTMATDLTTGTAVADTMAMDLTTATAGAVATDTDNDIIFKNHVIFEIMRDMGISKILHYS